MEYRRSLGPVLESLLGAQAYHSHYPFSIPHHQRYFGAKRTAPSRRITLPFM